MRTTPPALQRVYDRPSALLSVQGVPIQLPMVPVLQTWFLLTVHNIGSAGHLLNTTTAAMDRDQPIATLLTLALQRRIMAAGRAAAAALAASEPPSPPPSRSSASASRARALSPLAPRLLPLPPPALGAPPSPATPAEARAAAARSVLFSLGSAAKVPTAPEVKVEFVSLFAQQMPERAHFALEALKDMVARYAHHAAGVPGGGGAAVLAAVVGGVNEVVTRGGADGAAGLEGQEGAGTSAATAAAPASASGSDSAADAAASPGPSASEGQAASVGRGTSSSSSPEGALEASSGSTAVAAGVTTTSEGSAAGERVGRRTARRRRLKWLGSHGMPELARPALEQVAAAARVLVKAELKRDAPHRAAQALVATVAACAAAAAHSRPHHHHPHGGATGSGRPAGSGNGVGRLPGGRGAPKGPGEDLLLWGVQQLLKKHQPYLALEVIRSALSAGCCTPSLVQPLIHYCCTAGSDHALEALLGVLPAVVPPTAPPAPPYGQAGAVAAAQLADQAGPVLPVLAPPLHPCTAAVLDHVLDLVLLGSRTAAQAGSQPSQAGVPSSLLPPSLLRGTAATSSSASKGASAAAAASAAARWLGPLLGVAAARLGYVPDDDRCKALLGRALADGVLDAALAEATQGPGPTGLLPSRRGFGSTGYMGDSGRGPGEGSTAAAAAAVGRSRREPPLRRLLCCCGAAWQARLLQLAASNEALPFALKSSASLASAATSGTDSSDGDEAALSSFSFHSDASLASSPDPPSSSSFPSSDQQQQQQQLLASAVFLLLASADHAAIDSAAAAFAAAFPLPSSPSAAPSPSTSPLAPSSSDPTSASLDPPPTSRPDPASDSHPSGSFHATPALQQQQPSGQQMRSYLEAEGFSAQQSSDILSQGAQQQQAQQQPASTNPSPSYPPAAPINSSTSFDAPPAASSSSAPPAQSAPPTTAPNLASRLDLVLSTLHALSRQRLVPGSGLPLLLLTLHRHASALLQQQNAASAAAAAAAAAPAPAAAAASPSSVSPSPISSSPLKPPAGASSGEPATPDNVSCGLGAEGFLDDDGSVSETSCGPAALQGTGGAPCPLALLDLGSASGRVAAATLCLSAALCGRPHEANAMLVALSSHPPACLEALLHVALRDRLVALTQLTWHLKWACHLAAQAAKRQQQPQQLQQPQQPQQPQRPQQQHGASAVGAASTAGGGGTRHWARRSLLVKCLVVGQQSGEPEVMQQVYDSLSLGEALEAAAIAVQCGRAATDVRPLLKHVCARYGVRAAAEAPEFPPLINALARGAAGSSAGSGSNSSGDGASLFPGLAGSSPEQQQRQAASGQAWGLPAAAASPMAGASGAQEALAGTMGAAGGSTLGGVPPDCATYVAKLLVAATRSASGSGGGGSGGLHGVSGGDLATSLSAAGKRLAIRVCCAQGNHVTALKLWDAWQARHSPSHAGPHVLCSLLVAAAEVGDYAAGQALLQLFDPVSCVRGGLAAAVPPPSGSPSASAGPAATAALAADPKALAASPASPPPPASRPLGSSGGFASTHCLGACDGLHPGSGPLTPAAVFSAYLQVLAATTFCSSRTGKGSGKVGAAAAGVREVRQKLLDARTLAELETTVRRHRSQLGPELLLVSLTAFQRLWADVEAVARGLAARAAADAAGAPLAAATAAPRPGPGRPPCVNRKATETRKSQMRGVLLLHFLITRCRDSGCLTTSSSGSFSVAGEAAAGGTSGGTTIALAAPTGPAAAGAAAAALAGRLHGELLRHSADAAVALADAAAADADAAVPIAATAVGVAVRGAGDDASRLVAADVAGALSLTPASDASGVPKPAPRSGSRSRSVAGAGPAGERAPAHVTAAAPGPSAPSRQQQRGGGGSSGSSSSPRKGF